MKIKLSIKFYKKFLIFFINLNKQELILLFMEYIFYNSYLTKFYNFEIN